MTGPWFITPHARRRYRQRIDRRATDEGALEALVALAQRAHPVRPVHDRPGVVLWRGPRPLRLRCNVSTALPGAPQMVSVFPGCQEGRRAAR